jgi:hypothetical protein
MDPPFPPPSSLAERSTPKFYLGDPPPAAAVRAPPTNLIRLPIRPATVPESLALLAAAVPAASALSARPASNLDDQSQKPRAPTRKFTRPGPLPLPPVVKTDPMPPADYAKCHALTTALLDNHYSFWFRTPVDLQSEGAKAYYQAIQRPMDLGTVMRKLESDCYSKASEWEADVGLVWSNAMSFNAPNSIYWHAADVLRKLFEKEIALFALSEDERWLRRVAHCLTKLEAVQEGDPVE